MEPIIKNSDIEWYIDEYVHSDRDRAILKRRMIDNHTYSSLEDEFRMSERRLKSIVYKYQDKILYIMEKDGKLRY